MTTRTASAPPFFFFNDTATTEIYTLSPTRRSSDLVQDGPEFVAAPGIVVAHTDGRLAGIAPHDDKLHAFAKMVWERSHEDSLLCLLAFLFSFERERSEEHTSELQSQSNLVCRLLLEKQ